MAGILLLAPLIVVVLAAALFSVELPLLIGIGLMLVASRFAGLTPWTVVVLNRLTGNERRETTRSLPRAARRVREINRDPRVLVRWYQQRSTGHATAPSTPRTEDPARARSVVISSPLSGVYAEVFDAV